MSLFRQWIRRPRATWAWKLNFQLHLWAGLLLALYLILMGFTGSILVFRQELDHMYTQAPKLSGRPIAAIENVQSMVQASCPRCRIISILTPIEGRRYFVATLQDSYRRFRVVSDAQTGTVLGLQKPEPRWLAVVSDLHTTLLLGRRGRIANGIGAASLLAINCTGLVIWWPGIKLWRRGLAINLRRTWRRINFDLHRAIGFWAISILTFWAISGIYFGWPNQFFRFVNKLSPVVTVQPPPLQVKPVITSAEPSISTMISEAHRREPNTFLEEVVFPYGPRAPYEIVMQRPGGSGREYTDTLYFNPWDGAYLTTWRYGVNESVGDWLIWLQVPLHFGTAWGVGVKIVWAAAGLTIPLLAITGGVMYWNRVLRRLVRARA